MIYDDIINCLQTCQEHLDEGGGKITNVILREYKFPDNIKELIKTDYKTVKQIIDFYYNDFKFKINYYTNLIDALNNIEFIKLKSNPNKIKFIEYNDKIIPWLKSTDFFINIYEMNRIDEINPCDLKPIQPIDQFIPRENQKEAFDRLVEKGLENGIHCQATGCGKSFIIIKYLDYIVKTTKNPKVVLFTERVNILSDFFSFKKGSVQADLKKLEYWKNKGIGDLTSYDIINRVTIKKKDWITLLKDAKKPTLLVINRAYLTLGKQYASLEKNDLNLVLHDECHNTSSVQCHELLLKCKSLKVPIVGFSATPLRTGKDDKPKLLEIYSKPDKPTELNLLTDYNMIYAISKKLILPPEFHWYQLDDCDTEESKQIVTQQDLGSVLELLNHLVVNLPNKKLVAWCGTISLAKTWKKLFEKSYKQRRNLANFMFGLDTSETQTDDYDNFSKVPVKIVKNEKGKAVEEVMTLDQLAKDDPRRMYWGNSILFCASKHREGSDIKLLDGCVFLDKVKNRGAIPFIQSIGRVLRTCPDTPDKTKGVVIDGFVKEGNSYEKQFVDKIFGYYMALENLTSVTDTDKSKYDQYIEMRDIVVFDKEKEIINMKLNSSIIKIHCNKLEWDNIVQKFDSVLQERIRLSEDESELLEYNKLKSRVMKKKFVDKNEYYEYAKQKLLTIEPEIQFPKFWKSWYDFLGIDISIYPKTLEEWRIKCKKYGIKKENTYYKKCHMYGLPSMPIELYGTFESFEKEFGLTVKNKSFFANY